MTAPPTGPRPGRRGLAALAVLVGLAALAGLGVALSTPSAAVPVPPPEHYVALGDSYAAGPGIPRSTGVPVTCGRSTANYPSLVRDGIAAASFRDVSCAGATTADLAARQHTSAGDNPPQLDALGRDTTLVTLTLGGNDIGFSEIVDQCLARSPSQPNGSACRAYFQRTGRDLLAARVAATTPKLAEVLRQIRARAPVARVLVVGYPTILPAGGGCAEGPFSAGDVGYLNQTFDALNAVLEQQAHAGHAQYVDTARASAGHDICAPPGTRWVEGRDPSSPAAAFHPNALGMRNVAGLVLDALRGG